MRFRITVDVDYDEASLEDHMTKEDVRHKLETAFFVECDRGNLLLDELVVDDWRVEVEIK